MWAARAYARNESFGWIQFNTSAGAPQHFSAPPHRACASQTGTLTPQPSQPLHRAPEPSVADTGEQESHGRDTSIAQSTLRCSRVTVPAVIGATLRTWRKRVREKDRTLHHQQTCLLCMMCISEPPDTIMDSSTGHCSGGASCDRHSGTCTSETDGEFPCFGRRPAGPLRAFGRRQKHAGQTPVGSLCYILCMAID